MHIHTIEENFDYRMKLIVKDLLEQMEETVTDGQGLYDFLRKNPKELGRAVLDDMFEFQHEDTWLQEIEEDV